MCIRESIETREERVLHKSRSSTSTIITSGPISSISSLTAKKSRRKRKKITTTKIIISKSSILLIRMFQIMVMIVTLSSPIARRVSIVNGLFVTRITKSTTSGITKNRTSLLKTSSINSSSGSSQQISLTPSALNLALDSRELRFNGGSGDTIRRTSSGGSDNNDRGIDETYYNQEWFSAATVSATTNQPVLSLARAGLEDTDDGKDEGLNSNSKVNSSSSIANKKNNSDNNYHYNNMKINDSSDSDGITTNNNTGNNKEDVFTTTTTTSSSPYHYQTQQENQHQQQPQQHPPKRGYGPYINLSPEERELFRLIRKVRDESNLSTTMRVAGGWVRDKLLATPEFTRSGWLDNDDLLGINGINTAGTPQRLTSKYKTSSVATSAGRLGGKVIGDGEKNKNSNKQHTAVAAGSMQRFQQHEPVDIDIALDDMLGREFAELLNQCLSEMGEKTHGVGVVLKNPEKSKHLETATMKVGSFWIDFVNLRAEEYTQDSRIPDLMRIGTPAEDAFRRDLTINSLFYNINNGQVEDWTGRGFDDLRRCLVATPLAPLTTLLDDPLRTLRSVRFAARLRFTMGEALVEAARDESVRKALAEKVSRERIGCEIDLMLRSPDPVGAMRLLVNLNLARTVFPMEKLLGDEKTANSNDDFYEDLFERGLDLLSTNYEQLEDCNLFPPVWCNKSYQGSYTTHGTQDVFLCEDDDALRYMWYASFLKPLYDHSVRNNENGKNKKPSGRKANRSVVCKLLVDELKRPNREAEAVEKIMKGADDIRKLMDSGGDFSAVSILLSDIRVHDDRKSYSSDVINDSDGHIGKMKCSMNGKTVFTATENDPVWQHAMEFRSLCSKIMCKVGPLWRAALFLAMSEHITDALRDDLDYVIEGDIVDESQEELRQREIERYDSIGTAMQRIGLVGIWGQKPLMDGVEITKVLPNIPKGPTFRDVMNEQEKWMTLHPCAGSDILARHLAQIYPEYAEGVSKK